jgi:hypothetical protein
MAIITDSSGPSKGVEECMTIITDSSGHSKGVQYNACQLSPFVVARVKVYSIMHVNYHLLLWPE